MKNDFWHRLQSRDGQDVGIGKFCFHEIHEDVPSLEFFFGRYSFQNRRYYLFCLLKVPCEYSVLPVPLKSRDLPKSSVKDDLKCYKRLQNMI